MKATSATRFGCRRPLIDLPEITLMFLTLILQYLNELVEGKVRHLTSPKSFQVSVKVQRLKNNCIKLLTKFIGKQTEIANHISEIRNNAKQLRQEADAIVEQAKERVERMLLQ